MRQQHQDTVAIRARVLIVAEDTSFVQAVECGLRALAYAISRAGDRSTALAILKSDPPDVIVLESAMMERHRPEFLSEMRRITLAPIVVFASGPESPLLDEAFARGADDYVHQPLSPRILIAHLEAKLRRE
jgi:DNA-binding response OmpR family regulator